MEPINKSPSTWDQWFFDTSKNTPKNIQQFGEKSSKIYTHKKSSKFAENLPLLIKFFKKNSEFGDFIIICLIVINRWLNENWMFEENKKSEKITVEVN